MSEPIGPTGRRHHHWGRVLGTLVGAYAVLVAVLGLVGYLLVHVAAHSSFERSDQSVDRNLAAHRTPTGVSVTRWVTDMAQTQTVVVVVAIVALLLLLRRHWRAALFLVVAVAGETLTFVTITFLVHRPRPAVRHLDAAPPTSSFPSGHTAASVCLYGALAVLAFALVRWRPVRALAVLLAVAVPVAVGFARMYRGMHFPTDVAAGAVLGLIWLTVVTRTLAARVIGART